MSDFFHNYIQLFACSFRTICKFFTNFTTTLLLCFIKIIFKCFGVISNLKMPSGNTWVLKDTCSNKQFVSHASSEHSDLFFPQLARPFLISLITKPGFQIV